MMKTPKELTYASTTMFNGTNESELWRAIANHRDAFPDRIALSVSICLIPDDNSYEICLTEDGCNKETKIDLRDRVGDLEDEMDWAAGYLEEIDSQFYSMSPTEVKDLLLTIANRLEKKGEW